jgi:D-cysteine desulfhydrase
MGRVDPTTGRSPPADRALYRAFGPLRGLGHLDLATLPTPVGEIDLTSPVPAFRGRAWVKREDRSGAELGGNKVRKLEWLLGAATAAGRRTVLTSGGIGSNHALATTFYAAQAGLESDLVIFPHHVSPTSSRTLRAMCALGPRITFCPSDLLVPAFMAAEAARLRTAGRAPAIVLPGGSQPTGTLGAIDLGLELAEQVRSGEMEAPDAVVVPYGSGGTAAGICVGLQAGGVRCPVLAVRVYPLPLTSRAWLVVLARRALRLLRSGMRPDLGRLQVTGRYLGTGYAKPTEESGAAREIASGLGLELEGTYSAKAFAAFLDMAASPRWRRSNLLFVLTYDGRIPAGLDDAPDDVVPPRLRRYL